MTDKSASMWYKHKQPQLNKGRRRLLILAKTKAEQDRQANKQHEQTDERFFFLKKGAFLGKA